MGGIAKWEWREAEAGVVWKWNLHTGNEVEAMQVWWHGRDSKAALVEGHKAEAGLHYRDESSSMQGVIQTQENIGYR